MNAERLLAHYHRIVDAPDAVARLRRFILDLAMRGKLVPQDSNDEPAAELLKRIAKGKLDQADLPKGWRRAPVGALLDFQYGKGLKASERMDEGPVPVFGSNGVVGFTETPLTVHPSIIVGRKGSAGAVNLCDGPSWTTDVAYFVEAPSFFTIRFLLNALAALELDKLGKGVKPGLSRSDAYEQILCAPPLAEQHRIVAKVDELMALCDRLEAAQAEREATRDRLAAASLARLSALDPDTFAADARFALDALPTLTTRPDQIKQLQHTILDLAVRGKLVPQDSNDEPAAMGKLGHAATTFDGPFALPHGWHWSQFGAVAMFENGDRGKNYPNRDEYVEKGVAWINTGHIQPDGSLSVATMNYISREKYESLGGGKTRPGDLLYCLRGATFGKTAFVEPFTEGAIASSLMIVRPGPHLDRRFTYFYLVSPFGRSQLMRFDNGTAQPNLSSSNVKKYYVPVPPLAEQHRIVTKIDELMALCDRLEAGLATAADTRGRLLDALLAEALAPTKENLEAAQ